MTANRRGATVALAGVVLALLTAGGGAVAIRVGAGHGPASTMPSELKGVLPELEAFVQHTRGLQFKHLPKVRSIPDSKFAGLLLHTSFDGNDTSSGDGRPFQGVLKALGLITDKVDLGEAAKKKAGEVVGFYDSHDKTLYVRGANPTPYTREVLVHELTHALDDQYFGLDRPELARSGGDAIPAFKALVEGNALRVEQKWYESRSQEERAAIDGVDSGAAPGTGDVTPPDVFARLMAFPYAVGLPFANAIFDAGGQARLDATFRKPPTTTEQVLHPDRFLAGEGSRKVSPPRAGGDVIDEGSLGELGLILVTGTASSRSESRQAAEGWAGDSYRAWKQDNRTCIRWNIEMDTAADTADLVGALQRWAAGQAGSTVTQNGPVEVTNCR